MMGLTLQAYRTIPWHWLFLAGDVDVIPVDCPRTRTARQMEPNRSFPSCGERERETFRQSCPTFTKGEELARLSVGSYVVTCACAVALGEPDTDVKWYRSGPARGSQVLVHAANSSFDEAVRSTVSTRRAGAGIYFPDRRPRRNLTILEARIRDCTLQPFFRSHQDRAKSEIRFRRAQDDPIEIVTLARPGWTLRDASGEFRSHDVGGIGRERAAPKGPRWLDGNASRAPPPCSGPTG